MTAPLRAVHRIAAALAPALVTLFLLGSLLSELSGDPALVARAKRAILWTIPLLTAAIITAGATGARLARASRAPAVRRKRARSMLIGVNGAFVLLPLAIVLDRLASAGEISPAFHTLQAIEFVAGATNLTLMILNARDGRRMSGHAKTRAPSATGAPRRENEEAA